MLTRVGAAARRPELTVEEFQRHWMTNHGPTAGSIANLVRYVQHHAVLVDGRPMLPYPGFDACSELDFESLDAMDDGFARAAATGELKADEDRFVDKSRYSWVLGEVDVRSPNRPAAEVTTLVTWWRSHPAASPERLLSALTGEWEDGVVEGVGDALAGRRLIVARADWHEGRQPATADVVEVIAFDGLEAAISFVATTAHDLGPVLAGVAFGSERHVAHPVTIVSQGPAELAF
jgi:hypothetical protein